MKEKIFVGVLIISILMNLFRIPGGAFILVLIASILALFYTYGSVSIFNTIPLKDTFKKESYKNIHTLRIVGSIGLGISLAVVVIGILFTYMNWPGGEIQLIIGLASTLLVLIICIIKYSSKKDIFYKSNINRCLFWLVFGGLLIITKEFFPEIL